MAPKMGIRAYARHRNVTPAAVRKAIKSGRITVVDGEIDPAVADRDWAANTDESKPRNSLSGNPWGGRQDPPATSAFAAARAVRESYDARIREFEFKRMSGLLISKEAIERAVFDKVRRTRDHILAIPDRIDALLAAESDVQRCNALLTEELEKALSELSGSVSG